MSGVFLEKVKIENYRCIQSLELELTPLHALIGPNDSGKSTVLRAIQGAGAWTRGLGQSLSRDIERGAKIDVTRTKNGKSWSFTPTLSAAPKGQEVGVELLRLDPDALRKPSALIPHAKRIQLANDRGLGLPAIYDALLSRNLEAYIAIRQQVGQLFPTVAALQPQNATETTKSLGIKLTSGVEVGAEDMSEGLLYFLAFAALPYLGSTDVFLVEEPENGLHPARVAEVMRILREVSRTTQVLVATHSPLVVNELQGDEVTIITRNETGTHGVRLDRTPGYAERSKVYANGELWVSYADGLEEAALLEGGPRP